MSNMLRAKPTARVSTRRFIPGRRSVSRSALHVCAAQAQAPIQNGTTATDACKNYSVAVFSSKRYVRDFFVKPLRDVFPNSNFVEAPLDIDTAQLAKGYDAVVLFVNDRADAPVLERLAEGGVKTIAMRCAGFDRVDLEAAQRLGLTVVRVPTYSPQSVAEHAVAMMFALNRSLHKAHLRVSQGNYTLSGLVGMEITGKTVGVIGTGAIGAQACRLFKGLGMNVLAYDIRPNQYCVELGVEYTSVEDMLPRCHVVSLHCPLLPSTRNIVDAEAIKRMRPGTMLINVSRGGLIETNAIFDGLESGQIGALGLDVYENEDSLFFTDFTAMPTEQRMQYWDRRFRTLISYPQVLVTPHSAFLTTEALNNIATTTIENLTDCAMGRPCPNQVKPRPA